MTITTLDAMVPGRSLGRYECLMPIAWGGMAVVWAARARWARGFERTVALKLMLPSLSDSPNCVAMFLEEARIASRIRHPNVIEVIDLGESGSLLYLVMEWVDGEPLNIVLREARAKLGGVPLGIAARIIVDCCAGLHAAHEIEDEAGAPLGLVHRDVSPQNILLSVEGSVKLGDFGIAKATNRTSPETGPGQLKGKIAYMAPEQATGQRIDRRTDLYSLGIVLYELIAGEHPFRGANDLETLRNVFAGKVPNLREKVPSIPEAVRGVVDRALARNPAHRFSTAAEMAREMGGALGQGVELATSEAVREFLRKLIGERTDQRKAALRRAMEQSDGQSIGGQRVSVSAGDRTVLRQAPRDLTARPIPKRKARAIALGGACLLAVGASAYVLHIPPRVTETPSDPIALACVDPEPPTAGAAAPPLDENPPAPSAVAAEPPKSKEPSVRPATTKRELTRAQPAARAHDRRKWSQPLPTPGF